MRLVHKQPVNAEFLKGQRVVVLVTGGEGFETFLGLFQFFYQAPVVRIGVYSFDLFQFIQLLFEKAFLGFV